MGEFFRPMRRKIGVVTLVITLTFAVGWIRSQSEIDCVGIQLGNSFYACGSFRNALCLDAWNPRIDPPILNLGSMKQSLFDKLFPIAHGEQDVWFFPMRGMGGWIGETCFGVVPTTQDTARIVAPYWSIVIPLIFLSALLLLSKPRVAKPKSVGENSRPE